MITAIYKHIALKIWLCFSATTVQMLVPLTLREFSGQTVHACCWKMLVVLYNQHGEKLSESFVMDRKNSLGVFFLRHVVACFSRLVMLRCGLRIRLIEWPFRTQRDKGGRTGWKLGLASSSSASRLAGKFFPFLESFPPCLFEGGGAANLSHRMAILNSVGQRRMGWVEFGARLFVLG